MFIWSLWISLGKTKVVIHHKSLEEGDLLDKSVDLVVTSPPYGDSHTTVAYGQFSRLSNEWLGHENAVHIDRNLMGGQSPMTLVLLESVN